MRNLINKELIVQKLLEEIYTKVYKELFEETFIKGNKITPQLKDKIINKYYEKK